LRETENKKGLGHPNQMGLVAEKHLKEGGETNP